MYQPMLESPLSAELHISRQLSEDDFQEFCPESLGFFACFSPKFPRRDFNLAEFCSDGSA
jgi:hypothetical protein